MENLKVGKKNRMVQENYKLSGSMVLDTFQSNTM